MKKTNKLGHYLALTLGAGVAATSAEGATTVTYYGPGARTPSTTPATPEGINFGIADFYSTYQVVDAADSFASVFARPDDGGIFTRGMDLTPGSGSSRFGVYHTAAGGFAYFAQAGSENYANLSFDGDDGVYEAVAQFYLAPPESAAGAAGSGYLIAIAKNDDGSALSISAGKTAIDAGGTSAVPEASSHLALLALGSAGVLTRRRLKRAA